MSWRIVVSHVAAEGDTEEEEGIWQLQCSGMVVFFTEGCGSWLKTLEEGAFSEINSFRTMISTDPFSAVAQGGTQKVVSRLCCLWIEPRRLKNVLNSEV